MRTLDLCGLLLASSISLGLVACGTGTQSVTPAAPVTPAPVTPAPVPSPPTTLTGNWFLAGSRALITSPILTTSLPAKYPIVTTSLIVQGTTISGQIAISSQCQGSSVLPSTVSAEGFPIDGTIASDGTFQASTANIGSAPNGVLTLSLAGTSPTAAAPAVWTGTYSLAFTPGSSGVSCSIAQSASFVATPIASVTGMYIGVPGNSNPPFGTSADVSVKITQGAPTLVTRGNTSRYEIPLTANLTIANSPCAMLTATNGSTVPAYISGDSFSLSFPGAGSQGELLTGVLTDPTANTFSGFLSSMGAASCGNGTGVYTFTRK